jgi:predicted MFS family arabinose efflux permease
MPKSTPDDQTSVDAIKIEWFLCHDSGTLLGQAFSYGLIAAFYYTYAVDLVQRSGFDDAWGAILWTFVGVGGVTGILTGDGIQRFGLNRCLMICLSVLAASIGALTLTGGYGPAVVVSAVAFGASYMPIAAILVVWNSNIFYERPATGFSAVLFSLALGSVVGPATLGTVAAVSDLRMAFWCAAAMTAASIFLRPHTDIRSPVSDASANVSLTKA